DLANFLCMGFRQGTSKNSEILCKNINKSAIYGAVPCNYPVSVKFLFVHPKIGGPVGHKNSNFLKGTFIKQIINPFPCGKFFPFVLLGNSLFSPSQVGKGDHII